MAGAAQPEGAALPRVDGGRCVHAFTEGASCRACVDACPWGAWVLDDEQLGGDPERCDGCGLCAPACPQQAIEVLARPVRYRVQGREQAWAACRPSGVPGGPGLLGCLHALGVDTLAHLAAEGVGQLFLSRGDCDRCLYRRPVKGWGGGGRPAEFDSALAQVNALLGDQGRASMSVTWLSPEVWPRARDAAAALHRPPGFDRRAFFRRALGEVGTRLDSAPEGSPRTARQRLPSDRGDRLRPQAPRIDARDCDGCDACQRLCPTGAIVFRAEPAAYVLEADACSGCGLCVDHCVPGAIRVERGTRRPQEEVALDSARCPLCGMGFHVPAGSRIDRCPTCRARPHASRLFQVFD